MTLLKHKNQIMSRFLFCMLLAGLLGAGCLAAQAQEQGDAAVSVKLNKSSIVLVKGKSYRLKVSGKNLPEKLKWSSSNKKAVTVDSTGKITAKAAGSAVITVKAGKKKAVCKVKAVKAVLNKSSLSLIKGKTARLAVSGTSRKITWKSSNSKIVSVNSSGKIRAKKTGNAVIYAKIGVSRLACRVTVTYDRWDRLRDEYRDDDETSQLVFVRYQGGSRANVQMFRKSGRKWSKILDCPGYVGSNGIDKVKEGDRKTPAGTFTLTKAFGIKDDPGAKIPYVKVNSNLYWCADSAAYNQLIDIRKLPHACRGEHLIDYVPQYDYGMFLDFNKDCEIGKGSAIFLHCTGSNPFTAGCIAVSQANMIRIIQNAEKGAKICIYPI